MEPHYQLNDSVFEKQFENASLNPKWFSHEGHLRLAWIHVTQYGTDQAADNLCLQITQFDRKYGDGTKFHKTLTVAAVKMIAHFVKRSDTNNFQEFIQQYPKLKSDFKDLINQHYSFDIFQNEEAKHSYVEPDLLAF